MSTSPIYVRVVLKKKPSVRIDLYDTNGLADIEQCCAYWDVSCYIEHIYTDIFVHPDPIARTKGPADYQVEQQWIEEASKHFLALPVFLNIHRAKLLDSLDNISVDLYFGDYLYDYRLI